MILRKIQQIARKKLTNTTKSVILTDFEHNKKNEHNMENLILKNLYISFVKSRQYYILCYVTNVVYFILFFSLTEYK